MPEGATRRRLTDILQDIRTRYDGPAFLPHVTLVGGLQIERDFLIECTRRIAAAHQPFTIKLGQAEMTSHRFRDLFIHAGPVDLLSRAHAIACNVLGGIPHTHFMPHLSLLYGSHSRGLKERIICEIGSGLPAQFKVGNLYLYETDGQVRRWREVAKSPLG
jgi:2'-5' RNA ligase